MLVTANMTRIFHKFSIRNPITSDAIKIITHYKTFRNKYIFLQKSQYWNKEQLEEYQLKQLKKLLIHAYENVPYYSKLFDNRGIKLKDIKCLKDIQKLPKLSSK